MPKTPQEGKLSDDSTKNSEALSRIRRRRLILLGVILVYMPAMWLSLKLTGTLRGTAPAAIACFVLLVTSVTLSAVARCPQCGNYFHMQGMTLSYSRRCQHCGLHINADKNSSKTSNKR